MCGHDTPAAGCHLCTLAAKLDRHPPPAPPGPCRYRGEPLTASECVALGLPPARSWAPCGHPDQPNGVYVCPCKGCSPACVGYSSETNEV